MTETSLAKRLKRLRNKQKLSVPTLAELIGVNRFSIYKWERAESTPSRKHMSALAKLYQISLDEITYGKIQNTKEKQPTTIDLKHDLETACSFSDIEHKVTAFLQKLGLNLFFYKQIFRGDISEQPHVITITDIPDDWINHYRQQEYSKIDPTWKYSYSNVTPISNRDLMSLYDVANNKQLSSFFHDVHSSICPCFYVIPIHGGCCLATFVPSVNRPTIKKQELLKNSLDTLVHVGHIIYEAAHRVISTKELHKSKLTKIEIQVITLLARGESIVEIASIVHRSKAAVEAIINRAKIKLKAKNIPQLVLLAASKNAIPHNTANMVSDNSHLTTHGSHNIKY